MNITACLFDLDGVIVDTAKYHYRAWRNLATELGFAFTEAHNERLKGVSRMDSLEILLAVGGVTLSTAEKRRYAAEKNERYLAFIQKMSVNDILPGVREFLQLLRSQNIKIALGSVSKNAEMILEKLELFSLFDTIVDGRHITKAKPDPEVFLLGAKKLRQKPENCLVFEDAVAGVQAAKSAGMTCVGIGKQEVLKSADYVMPGFEGLAMSVFDEIEKSNMLKVTSKF